MNDNDFYTSERNLEYSGGVETVGRYTAKTFLWMFFGLMVTFGVAVLGYATTFTIRLMISVPFFQVLLLVAELAVVLILSSRIHVLSVPAARALFLGYAALNGIVFSAYFLLFDVASMVLVFGATGVYFGALALFGYATKADLSRLRGVLVSGLIFLLVFGVLSMFIPGLRAMDRILCLIGIAVFLAFTAYDTQKIKAFYSAYASDGEMLAKASIFSALQLYLDFINLFLYLLRFLGKRRN